MQLWPAAHALLQTPQLLLLVKVFCSQQKTADDDQRGPCSAGTCVQPPPCSRIVCCKALECLVHASSHSQACIPAYMPHTYAYRSSCMRVTTCPAGYKWASTLYYWDHPWCCHFLPTPCCTATHSPRTQSRTGSGLRLCRHTSQPDTACQLHRTGCKLLVVLVGQQVPGTHGRHTGRQAGRFTHRQSRIATVVDHKCHRVGGTAGVVRTVCMNAKCAAAESWLDSMMHHRHVSRGLRRLECSSPQDVWVSAQSRQGVHTQTATAAMVFCPA
jgi:hypothetical protein